MLLSYNSIMLYTAYTAYIYTDSSTCEGLGADSESVYSNTTSCAGNNYIMYMS